MIIIFDTYGGLCNQFYDINCGINFCIMHNIQFAFRYCSFRKDTLKLNIWIDKNFYNLFDKKFIENIKPLYIDDYSSLNITNENCYNFKGDFANNLFTNNYENEILKIDKQIIILKQFSGIFYRNPSKIINNLVPQIKPSENILNLYNNIKNKILGCNTKYNFIHYRYETDFTNYFKISIENLKPLILRIKTRFKDPSLKIYIATSNIKSIINLNDPELCQIILTKEDDKLNNYNFEELAFVDYMFGLNSNEVFGHSKSSFSTILNNIKNTKNYYD